MVVGVDHHCLPALDACPQVIFDQIARPLLVVKDGAVIHHKACTVHAAGQPRTEEDEKMKRA